jgi:hypothetical protein
LRLGHQVNGKLLNQKASRAHRKITYAEPSAQ